MNFVDHIAHLRALFVRYGVRRPSWFERKIGYLIHKLTRGETRLSSYRIVWQLRHSSETGPREVTVYRLYTEADLESGRVHAVQQYLPVRLYPIIFQYLKQSTTFTITPIRKV